MSGRPAIFYECYNCRCRSASPKWCLYCGEHYALVGNARPKKVVPPKASDVVLSHGKAIGHNAKEQAALYQCRGCLRQSASQDWCAECRRCYAPATIQTLDDCRDRFDRYRTSRSKKHGKKAHNYKYGKSLATNMAAPFILRLKAEIKSKNQ